MPFPVDPSALLQDEGVKQRTAAFALAPPFAVPDTGVCVLQGEVACISSADFAPPLVPPPYIGSIDATTCCLVFVRTLDNALQAATHLDFDGACPCFYSLLAEAGFFTPPERALEVSLVGSYQGGSECSTLVAAILASLHACPCPLTLRIAAVLDSNPLTSAPVPEASSSSSSSSSSAASTASAPATLCPSFHAAAMDTATGEVRAAAFASAGPHELQRAARCFIQGNPLPLVCAYQRGAWAAPALPGAPGASGLSWGIPLRACQALLAGSDAALLQATSTSPSSEAPGYAAKMRRLLAFIASAHGSSAGQGGSSARQ
jgi:hypothetical protein